MFGFVSSYLDIGELMSPRDEGLGARLRALPLFDPPAGGWPSLERRRRHRAMRATTGWAMAASVLLAVIVGGWQFRAGPGDGAASTTVALLESQSRALEQTLQQARKQTVVWDGERAQRSAELESQVALVDLQIGYADAKSADELWRDRLSLMTALVETHSSNSAASDDGDLVEY